MKDKKQAVKDDNDESSSSDDDSSSSDEVKGDAKADPKDKRAKGDAKADPKDKRAKADAKADPKDKRAKVDAKADPKDKRAKADAKADPKDKRAKADAKADPKDKRAKADAKADPKDKSAKGDAKADPKDKRAKGDAKADPKDKKADIKAGPKGKNRKNKPTDEHSDRELLKNKQKKKKEFTSKDCIDYTIFAAKVIFRIMVLLFFFWVMHSLLNVFEAQEKVYDKRHCVIPAKIRLPENYTYYVTPLQGEQMTVNLKLEGPFLPALQQNREYSTEMLTTGEAQKPYVFVCILERWLFNPKLPEGYNRRKLKRPDKTMIQEGPAGSARLIMKNDSGTTHTYPLDYNNYPRDARLTLQAAQTAQFEKMSMSNFSVYYALGFGVSKAQKRAVPFSVSYKIDPITMKTRVLLAVTPLVVFATLVSLNINRGVAAYVTIVVASLELVQVGEPCTVVQLLKLMDADLLFYIFSTNLVISLLVETKVYSWLAFKYVSLTNLNFWASILLINILAGFLSIWFNNIYIAALLLPLTVRLMELVGVHPVPVILNMVFMCNITGKAYVGTFASKQLINHKEAINNNINLKTLMKICMGCAILVAFVTLFAFLLVYKVLRVQHLGLVKEIHENRHLMNLWYRYSQSIPNVSVRYHIIKRKMTKIRRHLYQEVQFLKASMPPYDFPLKKNLTVKQRLQQMAPDNRLQNKFLLVKCLVLMAVTGTAMIPFVYNLTMKIWTYEEIRLGYIGLYIMLLSLFLVHSRDFELILKRIDFSALLVFIALNLSAKIAVLLTLHMDDFVWKTYGAVMTGTRKENIHAVLVKMLAYTSVSGYFNEHVMFSIFQDTLIMYSIFQGLDALAEILAGFMFFTGYWGHVTMLGTAANIVVAGMAEQQGYRISIYQWMSYGICFAVLDVLTVYLFILLKYLK